MSSARPARETADVETSSAGYAERFSGRTGAWMLGVQRRATERILGDGRAGSILELGGGHGQATDTLAALGTRLTVTGSELACRERLRSHLERGRCTFVVADLLELPFEDRSFDTVLTYRLLPHVTRWHELLVEAARVGRKTLVLDYPVSRGTNAAAPLLFPVKKRLEGNTRTYRSFRSREIDEVLEPLGFVRETSIAQFALPMVLHRVVGRAGLSERAEAAFRRAGVTERFGSPVIARFRRV